MRRHDPPAAVAQGKRGLEEKGDRRAIAAVPAQSDHESMVLRSSCHTLEKGKGRKSRRNDPGPRCVALPAAVRRLDYVAYDADAYDLGACLARVLERSGVGTFDDDGKDDAAVSEDRLARFRVDLSDRAGAVAKQVALTSAVREATDFLREYERLVRDVFAPRLQRRLLESSVLDSEKQAPAVDDDDGSCSRASRCATTAFYYQYPPTVRVHPAGAATVKTHKDRDYGHQDGEVNVWLPLSACEAVLWVESEEGLGDFAPLEVKVGRAATFHGTACRHLVPANDDSLKRTRVSLDFRLAPAVGNYFDPSWQLKGTIADHERRVVEVVPPYRARVEDAVRDLVATGVACLRVDSTALGADTVFEAFPRDPIETDDLGEPEQGGSPSPPRGTEEIHGFHRPGALSRSVNEYREGYVFQAGLPVRAARECGPHFEEANERFREAVLERVAAPVLRRLADVLDLPVEAFTTGVSQDCKSAATWSFDVLRASQFHVKRLVGRDDATGVAVPAHVDPSLISLVFHAPGAAGLEVLLDAEDGATEYRRVPQCGPDTCVLLAGSLLARLEPRIPARRHRVRSTAAEIRRGRIAATFFLQPAPDARLVPFEHVRRRQRGPEEDSGVVDDKDDAVFSSFLTYGDWKRRAHRNYAKRHPR